ncbi:hypothetical protein BDY19DRAFT_976495 [Irpex rosettiformis]|uniref:Uncharacterized protein n=1 Tax=Irpex rosettiformis TaxID=378272 RepID=A0ACB8TPD7_9APHY|nr:hypothetical protein BDY19DRAFT_976495 [Irpex rosettiformis]
MYLAFTLFVAARTYAIWDKNKLVLISVLGLGLLYPVGYMYYCSQRGAKASLSPAIGCQFVSTLPAGTSLNAAQGHILCVLGAVVGILFECLTVALTWVKMIFVVRQLRRSNMSNQPSLSRVMFYNGTVILIANVLSVLLNAFGVLTNITQTLTSILVTRFILDLREDYYVTSENDNDDVSVHVSYLSDVRFVSQGPVVTVFSASDPSLGTRMTDGP